MIEKYLNEDNEMEDSIKKIMEKNLNVVNFKEIYKKALKFMENTDFIKIKSRIYKEEKND